MRAPRTPTSLKWLITRRARLDGEITKIDKAEAIRRANADKDIAVVERQLNAASAQETTMREVFEFNREALLGDLAATDRMLRQHEVAIDPNIISPIRSHDNVSIADHGFFTRAIFECLRLANGAPCTATKVTSYIAVHLMLEPTDGSFMDLRMSIRHRMKHLTWEGRLKRVPNQIGSLEGRWTLNAEPLPSSQSDIHPDDDDPASIPATTGRDRS